LDRRTTRLASALLRTALLAALVAAPSAYAQAGDPAQDNAPAMAMGAGRMVRGTVSAVAGDKVTLKTEAGDTFQVALTPNTRVMKDRQQIKPAEIRVGDGIGAMGELDRASKTVHALFVSVVSAEEVKKMKESFGKTWISGKVTAIDDLRITILRSDKISQTIAVDEDTSFKRGGRGMAMAMQGGASVPMGPGEFRRGSGDGGVERPPSAEAGEPITLADVKVGDVVAGQGALKNGTFIPTTLAVSDPSQRRRRDGSNSAGNAPATNPGVSPQ
jgi:hypothetical protein